MFDDRVDNTVVVPIKQTRQSTGNPRVVRRNSGFDKNLETVNVGIGHTECPF